jgi:tellurite resistance protein
MKLETATLRRLRDALLQSGRRDSGVFTDAYAILARADLLSDIERRALARVDPMAETMFLMMAADEQTLAAEKDAIRGAIRELTDDALQDGTIDVLLERYGESLAKHGREARLKEIALSLTDIPDDAETAFTLAAAVALADEHVAREERAFVEQLAQWFAITPERTAAILSQLDEDRSEAR